MKGISTILAMILIVIITVALIGLTYTFAANLFQQTTSAATTTTTSVTGNMQKTVDIISAVCYNNTNTIVVTFALRGNGQQNISSGQLSASLDNMDISNNATVPGQAFSVANDTLAVNQIRGYNYSLGSQTFTKISTRTLSVTTPAGTITQPISNCPS